MPANVSVVVPVWNPGPNLDRCIDSLLAQTLSVQEYEIVLVDDGSTDGTAARLDEIAAAHPDLVRVLHTPNSGWPGRPRNIGIDAAEGEFVHLVDNDDTLPPYALQALYAAAVETSADVIMGRPASDFRGLNHTIYRADVRGGTLADHPELTETLTPHKMFRRSLLVEHAIRFPEGPVPLEDQMFVMKAYLHARAITVLTDRPYYFYLRRIGSGRNAGDRRIDPVAQSAALEQVLDIVEDAVPAGPLRDRLFRRFYRINLLPRLAEQAMLDYDEAERTALLSEIRRVVSTRFPAAVHEDAGAAHRALGRLLLDGAPQDVLTAAGNYVRIGARASVPTPAWVGRALVLDVSGELVCGDEPVRCDRVDGGWALPSALLPGVPVADRLLDPTRDEPDLELALTSRASSASFGLVDGLRVGPDDEGVLRLTGRVSIDPSSALAGRPMDPGVWEVRLRIRFAGWNRGCAVAVSGDAPLPFVRADGVTVTPLGTGTGKALTLDVGQWATSVAAQVAPTSSLTALSPVRLQLRVGVSGAGAPVELYLQPEDETPGGVLACTGALEPDGDGQASATLRLPVPAHTGSWRPWLRVADAGAGSARALPWRVTTSLWRLRVEPAAVDS